MPTINSKMLSSLSSVAFVALLLLLMTLGAHAEAEDEADHGVYNKFAQCTDLGNTFKSGYTIKLFSAELLMDTHVDTYTDHYNYVAAGTARSVSR